MALMSRISEFLQRTFSMSESEDVFEEEGAEGFLMTVVKEEPAGAASPGVAPVAPLATAAEAQQPRAQALPPVPEPVEIDAPALSSLAQAPAPESADLDDLVASAEAPAVSLDGEADLDDLGVLDDLAPSPGNAEEAASASSPLDAPEPKAESAGDMLSMFRETMVSAEFVALTKDIEDVPGVVLLADAREVRDLLIGSGASTDNAA